MNQNRVETYDKQLPVPCNEQDHLPMPAPFLLSIVDAFNCAPTCKTRFEGTEHRFFPLWPYHRVQMQKNMEANARLLFVHSSEERSVFLILSFLLLVAGRDYAASNDSNQHTCRGSGLWLPLWRWRDHQDRWAHSFSWRCFEVHSRPRHPWISIYIYSSPQSSVHESSRAAKSIWSRYLVERRSRGLGRGRCHDNKSGDCRDCWSKENVRSSHNYESMNFRFKYYCSCAV